MRTLTLFALASVALLPSRGFAQPTDLLRAVGTELAVSSVYRGQARQAHRLVDGTLDSAWNSSSGDLVGAWIEVRLPADARVTGVALTAGFTHRPDLFEGNHRVTRVRILREGEVLAERPVDPRSREMQTLAVEGGGGVYRIEVTGVLPGSRASWRELCISELQVLGTAPGMRPGARFPRIAVGALPVAATTTAPPDRAAVARTHRQLTARLLREWSEYERALYASNQDTGTPGPTPEEIVRLRATRERLLARVLQAVEDIDVERADGIRAAIAREDTYYRAAAPNRELAALASAMAALAEWLGDDTARCRWARAHADLRMLRVEHQMRSEVYFAEVEGTSLPADDARRVAAIERAVPRLERLRQRFEANPRGAAASSAALRPPPGVAVEDLAALREQLDEVAARCAAR